MINSKMVESPKESCGYPKLMKHNNPVKNLIVLVAYQTKDGMGAGSVVHSSDTLYSIGYYSTTWELHDFDDYSGEVVIRNK